LLDNIVHVIVNHIKTKKIFLKISMQEFCPLTIVLAGVLPLDHCFVAHTLMSVEVVCHERCQTSGKLALNTGGNRAGSWVVINVTLLHALNEMIWKQMWHLQNQLPVLPTNHLQYQTRQMLYVNAFISGLYGTLIVLLLNLCHPLSH